MKFVNDDDDDGIALWQILGVGLKSLLFNSFSNSYQNKDH